MNAGRKMKSIKGDRKLNGMRGSQDVFANSGRKSIFIDDSQYNNTSLPLEYISGTYAEANGDYKTQKSNSSTSFEVKWCDDIPLTQKSQEIDRDGLKFIQTRRDIGTMTDYTPDKNLELETKCNELFGRLVACEISSISGTARYDKMKEIIGLFQNLNNKYEENCN